VDVLFDVRQLGERQGIEIAPLGPDFVSLPADFDLDVVVLPVPDGRDGEPRT
jgi:hypothetical protein